MAKWREKLRLKHDVKPPYIDLSVMPLQGASRG
jgi:hypothetical protein